MPKKKRKEKHKTCLIFVFIWYLIIFLNVFLLYAFPFTSSFYSSKKIAIIYITLGIIASIPLYYSLRKSFRRNIIYVHIIFILLTAIPILVILINIVSVKFDEDKMSLFEPYNSSCSMYHKQKDFDIWWDENSYWYEKFNITKEMFEAFPLKRGFSSEYFLLEKKNVSSDDINIGDIVLYKYEDYKSTFTSRVVGKEFTTNISYILLSNDNNRMYHWGIIKENVYARLEETFQSKLFRFFARDGCGY